jgi:hypothetical protein
VGDPVFDAFPLVAHPTKNAALEAYRDVANGTIW